MCLFAQTNARMIQTMRVININLSAFRVIFRDGYIGFDQNAKEAL